MHGLTSSRFHVRRCGTVRSGQGGQASSRAWLSSRWSGALRVKQAVPKRQGGTWSGSTGTPHTCTTVQWTRWCCLIRYRQATTVSFQNHVQGAAAEVECLPQGLPSHLGIGPVSCRLGRCRLVTTRGMLGSQFHCGWGQATHGTVHSHAVVGIEKISVPGLQYTSTKPFIFGCR